jgi:molecular chaperone DnaK (HSP70)
VNGEYTIFILRWARGVSDISKDDIQEMEREVEKTKKQRHETASLPKLKEQVEILVQSAGRKLKRWSFSSSSS